MLLRQVVKGEIRSENFAKPNTTELTTMGGGEITLSKEGSIMTITSSTGSSKVRRTDILANNGVMHTVDTMF